MPATHEPMRMALARLIRFIIPVAFVVGVPLAHAADGFVPLEDEMTHKMMVLVIQLGFILFAAKWGRILFERIRMPGVLGELCAGMIIGPFALGSLGFNGFPHGLFPDTVGFPISPELYGIASVAAIVLLFMAGLETDLKLFLRYAAAGGIVGIGGVVGSFVLGDLITIAFSQWVFGRTLFFFDAPCLFLGIISAATSVGITARVLAEKRKMDSPEGVTILAGAVVDDVLGIILLAVVLGLLSAKEATGRIDWAHIGMIAFKAVGIWLLATFVGLRSAHRISRLLKGFRQRSAIAVMSLGLALILAGIFEEAGLAMIIGAYVMGLSLSQTDISRLIQEKLEPLHEFLVPVFFCVMGMMVNFKSLNTVPIFAFGVLYTATAILAKIVGCSIPALFFNFNGRGALRVGAGMIPRGEVALIITGIGLASGFLDRQAFGVAVLMTVLTTAFAPIALAALFHNPAEGTRTPVDERRTEPVVFDLPSPETAELLTSKILDIFEQEGFFTYALEYEEQLYQMRKDDLMIGLQCAGARLHFDCRRRDIPLVNAAVYEVLGEFEALIRGLERPIDRESIARQFQAEPDADTAAGAHKSDKKDFSLEPYLREDCLIPRLQGDTKDALIEELIDVLDRAGRLRNRDHALEAVRVREEVMSTGMQFGIALPHAKTDTVEDLVCAIGLKPEGVDFDALDDEPTTVVILELVPNRTNVPHIQFMSAISNTLDESTRQRLLACETPTGMLSTLLRGETAS